MNQIVTQVVKDRWRQHKIKLQRAQEREARRAERQYLLVSCCSLKTQADPKEAPQDLLPEGQPHHAKQATPSSMPFHRLRASHPIIWGVHGRVSRCSVRECGLQALRAAVKGERQSRRAARQKLLADRAGTANPHARSP